MNGRTVKRSTAILLAFLLFFELIPFQVFAEETDASVATETEEPVMEEADIDTGSGPAGGGSGIVEDAADHPGPEDGITQSEDGSVYTDEIIVEEYENNTAPAEKGDITEEIPLRREEYIKEFMLENGMTLATIYPIPIHYEKSGNWEEIDNTLVLREEDGAYHNTAGVWDIVDWYAVF